MVSLMSLEALRVEEQALSSDDLLLEADTGESLEVQAIGVSGCNDNDTIQVAIGEETMLSFQFDSGGYSLSREPHRQPAD